MIVSFVKCLYVSYSDKKIKNYYCLIYILKLYEAIAKI